MVFSTNQARQFYVMKGNLQTSNAPTDDNTVQVTETAGAPYVTVMGALGTITRSDLLTGITSVKVTDAGALSRKLKSVKVTLDSAAVDASGNAIAGQDYILRIAFSQFGGMSDEEKYFKYGMVHGVANMTPSTFYKTLAKSLVMNFSRELTPLVSIKIHSTAGGDITVEKGTTLSATDYTYVLINEVEQEWTLGIKESVPVHYDVTTDQIVNNGDSITWGTVVTSDSTKDNHGNTVSPIAAAGTVTNSKKIADLEYFYMGERGDIYRNIGWPKSIPTKYLVDEKTANGYAVLDIHYGYKGTCEDVQNSEKDITIVTPQANKAQLVSLAEALAGAAGMTTYTSVASTGVVTEETI